MRTKKRPAKIIVKRKEVRLKIDAYSPETMPMKRLAEYLSDMAVLLGEEQNVHLVGIEGGSTCPVVLIDWEAEPKVHDRIKKARTGDGPPEAVRAIDSINFRLKKDNASGRILAGKTTPLIEFPGVKAVGPLEWPSINQATTLYGVPIWVGGKSELANIDLEDGDREWKCLASRDTAIRIASCLYQKTIRVNGNGRWRKIPGGVWELERFVIEDFSEVSSDTIDQAITNLRSIPGSWKNLEDLFSTCSRQHKRS